MRALIAALLATTLLHGCTKPQPQWTSTILAAPDRPPAECREDVTLDAPKSDRMTARDAALWQSYTIDRFAELRKNHAICAAWAERQRPKK